MQIKKLLPVLFILGLQVSCDDCDKSQSEYCTLPSPETTPTPDINPEDYPTPLKGCKLFYRVYKQDSGLFTNQRFTSYETARAYIKKQDKYNNLIIIGETICEEN